MQLKVSAAQIWKIAFPVMIGGLGQNIINITDVAFLGRVGEVELGACGLAVIWYFTFITLGMGVSSGTQVLTARRSGQDDDAGIGAVVNHALIIGTGISILLFFLFYFGSKPLLAYFIRSERVLEATVTYMHVRAFDVFFVVIAYILRGFYNGLGKNQIIIWGTVAMAAINFALNYALIFGHFGFPKMGIAGSALASVIAQAVFFAVLAGDIFIQKYHKKYKILKRSKWDASIASSIINISAPTALQYLSSMASYFFFIITIEKLGERMLAVSEVVKTVYILYMIPTWGFGTAASTLVSNLLGSEKPDEVPGAMRKTVNVSVVVSGLLVLTLFVFPEAILAVYTNDASIIRDSITATWIAAVAVFFYGISNILLQSIIGMGATRYAFVVEVATILIYCIYVGVAHYGFAAHLETLWLAEIIYCSLLGLFSLFYIRTGRWRKLSI